jgi:hypothetical protein
LSFGSFIIEFACVFEARSNACVLTLCTLSKAWRPMCGMVPCNVGRSFHHPRGRRFVGLRSRGSASAGECSHDAAMAPRSAARASRRRRPLLPRARAARAATGVGPGHCLVRHNCHCTDHAGSGRLDSKRRSPMWTDKNRAKYNRDHLRSEAVNANRERRRGAGRIPPCGANWQLIDDDGLPNVRPIAFSDSPRCQRSHNSVFSAAVKPRRNL